MHGENTKPKDDLLEDKAQEDKREDSDEEEDPQTCPVADSATLEKATDLDKLLPSQQHPFPFPLLFHSESSLATEVKDPEIKTKTP